MAAAPWGRPGLIVAALALVAAAACAPVPDEPADASAPLLDCRLQEGTQLDYEAGAGATTREQALQDYFDGAVPAGYRATIDGDTALVRDDTTGALAAVVQFEPRGAKWVVSYTRYCSDRSETLGGSLGQ